MKVYRDDAAKLKVYRGRVASAENILEDLRPKVEDHLGRYRNDVRISQVTTRGHRVSVPTGIGVIDSMFAALTAVDISVLVENLAKGTPEQAKVAEKAVSEVFREQRTNRKGAKSVKDALICKMGWFKVFYDYAEAEVTRERPGEDIDADMDLIIEGAEAEGMDIPTPDELTEIIPMTEKVVEVQRDRVVHEYVPWDEVLFDPFARNIEDIRWYCQVKKVPKDDITGNTDFIEYQTGRPEAKTSKRLEEIKPDSALDKKYLGNRQPSEDDMRVTLYEMWDLETATVTTFVKDGKFVIYEAANPFAFNEDLEDKSPYVPLVLREDPEGVRGISDMELIAPSLDELNVYRSNLATYLERLKPKILGPASAMTDETKNAMESQEWGVYVPLEDNIGANDIMPLAFPQLPQEMFGMIERIVQDIREATGQSELMRGLFPDRKRTATETMAVEGAGDVRQSEKRNQLMEFYTAIARKTLQLIQMFYDAPRITRLAGDYQEGEDEVVWEWDAESVTAEMDLYVELAPKEPKNHQTRKEDAFMVLNVVGAIPQVDQAVVAKWALCEMGIDEKIVNKFLKNDADMQAEQQAALQQQAAQTQAADGVMPDPSMVPGPMGGEELMAAANPGELPPEALPPVGDE